ncbi:hypothetical protein B0H17DRAFT_173666 [Mycena rosella]|uniref:Uncharacterized protein n=1 Tax=Mycena rosella TaxID=1033263 RepID=A0AAD7GAL1_MYCRO|nr:hypothetical protein B0H17DRAFT_173666 [Mycena rosella]
MFVLLAGPSSRLVFLWPDPFKTQDCCFQMTSHSGGLRRHAQMKTPLDGRLRDSKKCQVSSNKLLEGSWMRRQEQEDTCRRSVIPAVGNQAPTTIRRRRYFTMTRWSRTRSL